MAYYPLGMEPEKLKKRMNTLFEKLNTAYPDKNIVSLTTDHKHWAETVTELYRELGYPDGKSFLEAYGYKYVKKGSSTGRPKFVDPEVIIKNLQKRYPNGSPFKTADELFAGTEYESKLKTLKNCSNDVFGMPLGMYLRSIGLIQSRVIPKVENTNTYITRAIPKVENTNIHIICKVRPTALINSFYYTTTSKTIHEGDIVEIPIGFNDYPVFGTVEEVITCNVENIPPDVEATKSILRKVGVREYNAGLLSSILHARSISETVDLIGESKTTEFKINNYTEINFQGNIPWAYCRGLSTEIMAVIDYLIKKDNQIYDYSDVILADTGIAELFVYLDDAKEVMSKYPSIKMAMFVENITLGIADFCYSRSGYSIITDSYTVGRCDAKSKNRWTIKHSPINDFTEGDINFTFKFYDDWNSINYVYTDKHGAQKRMGE